MSTEKTTDFSSSQAKSKENRNENQTTMSTEKTTDFSSSQVKSPESPPNVLFYKNKIPAKPNNEHIEEILNWREDYDELEYNHSYIQWLFPNRDMGMNSLACALTDKEAEIIRTSDDLRGKVKAAFEMMLDFYGMELTKNNEFKLAENSEERLAELNKRYNHNFLRITRILLALKELGHKELTLPWMKFLADLIYKENKLNCAQSSFENFWIDTLDAEDKLQLTDYRNTLLRNTKSKEKLISSSSDNVSPVSTTPNDNDDLENSTPNIFPNSDKSTPTPSTDSMSSSPVSDTSKDTEAKATEVDVDAKSTSTNINDTVPKSTPTVSTDAMASSQVSDTSKPAEEITKEDDAKSTLNMTSEKNAVTEHISYIKKEMNQFC
ncbi:Opioid growth factor receptor-like protein 1,Opioid growth factor receptor [Acanthosepion pharaonis]|uniref:Opioid growth factor receptor-like protein 1,Opioid growth factor receptor n=1 Tax=Acanthosepion pharaonis TaxID=158019 RepID=A0A812CY74_ACAPH|nr:Opioid growth factor receptor-like protein 1,Opioid growth factor receptor [Sepia pharaonis]